MDAWLIDWFGSNLGVHWKWEWKWNGNEVMDWYENTWKWMKMSGNEKTELKLLRNCTLSDNWNTYDPFGEVFFFAVGPFLKHSVFLAPAFAFGCGFFLAPAFAFGCGLLRERSSSSLSPSSAFALNFTVEWWVIQCVDQPADYRIDWLIVFTCKIGLDTAENEPVIIWGCSTFRRRTLNLPD